MNLYESIHVCYRYWWALKIIESPLLLIVLTKNIKQMTYKDVRFDVQTYTDRGPAIEFKNG